VIGLKSAVRKVQKNGPNFGVTYQACPKPSFEDRCSFFQFCGVYLEEQEQATSAKNIISDENKSQKMKWVKCTSSNGQSYYYNSLNGVSQWRNPN
jgi:hypothetical protein